MRSRKSTDTAATWSLDATTFSPDTDVLCEELAHSVRAMGAVLDGEIVCLDAQGRSTFYPLLFRRDWPFYFAFDVLSVDGEDLRAWPLHERKRRLRSIMSRSASRLLSVEDLPQRGAALFEIACSRDLKGIVGKWRDGRYETDGISTSWIKIKNPAYSQMTGRRELFETRRDQRQRGRRNWRAPILRVTAESAGHIRDVRLSPSTPAPKNPSFR